MSVSCTVGTHSAAEPSLLWSHAAGGPGQLSPPPETEASVCVCVCVGVGGCGCVCVCGREARWGSMCMGRILRYKDAHTQTHTLLFLSVLKFVGNMNFDQVMLAAS